MLRCQKRSSKSNAPLRFLIPRETFLLFLCPVVLRKMKAEFLRILLVVAFFCVGGKAGFSSPGAGYYMAEMGESCYQRCLGLQLNCNADIQTDNSTELFNELGINCTADTRPWWSEDQPAYVSDPSDSNYGRVCVCYSFFLILFFFY